MKNLNHQTKQAFLFSLAFYLIAIFLIFFKVDFAPILFSISLLISLIWVFLVLREIIFSTSIGNGERLLLTLFIISTNIVGGIVYFFLIRQRVVVNNN